MKVSAKNRIAQASEEVGAGLSFCAWESPRLCGIRLRGNSGFYLGYSGSTFLDPQKKLQAALHLRVQH